MKTELTKEQSQRLIELGVPEYNASGSTYTLEPDYAFSYPRDFRCFTLTDLLEILPKEIYTDKNCPFRIESWFVECVVVWDIQYVGIVESFIQNKELIDALYELLCWVIENKYLKFD